MWKKSRGLNTFRMYRKCRPIGRDGLQHIPMYASHLGTFFLSAQNKGGSWCKKKKNTNLRNRKASLVPPIKPLEGPNQRIRSAHRHRIKELNSQVWELQQQLSGVATENKLLKQLQVRHTVALQRFQDSQSGLPQVCCSFSGGFNN